MLSAFVTKYGEIYPLSNCIPSTTSTYVSVPFASSTVITPSVPTFSIAFAIKVPISSSLFAEIVPTCLILEKSFPTFSEMFFNSATTA